MIRCLAATLGLAFALAAAAPAGAQTTPATAVVTPSSPAAAPTVRAPIPSAREVLERAFDNFFIVDLHQNLRWIVSQSGHLALEYKTEMQRKFIDGVAYDLFFIRGSGDRRHWKILRVEQLERADDIFVYLPELLRPRRYPGAQRGDKFMGLELTIEDLEIRRIKDYEIVGRTSDRIDGELVYVITVQPLRVSGYDRTDYFISARDYAILHIRFYQHGATEPYKLAWARREWMQYYDNRVLPRRMDFIDRSLKTETTIFFDDRRVDPSLPSSRFSVTSLEKRIPARGLAPLESEQEGVVFTVGADVGARE